MSQDRRGVETKHKSTFKPGSGGCAERWRCAAGKVVSAGRWRGREEEEEEGEEEEDEEREERAESLISFGIEYVPELVDSTLSVKP